MRILVVEDEQKLAEGIERGLTAKGFAVDTIDDGEKALTRLSIHHKDYDLVVLDLMLPSLDGYAICKEARARDIVIPILVLTARAASNRFAARLSAYDDVLIKIDREKHEEKTKRLRSVIQSRISISETLIAEEAASTSTALSADAKREEAIRAADALRLQAEMDVALNAFAAFMDAMIVDAESAREARAELARAKARAAEGRKHLAKGDGARAAEAFEESLAITARLDVFLKAAVTLGINPFPHGEDDATKAGTASSADDGDESDDSAHERHDDEETMHASSARPLLKSPIRILEGTI